MSTDSTEQSSAQKMSSAGSAYLVEPDGGAGPGVLVLHSWWGLNRGVKDLTEALASAGYTALAPNLFAGTELQEPDNPLEAAQRLARLNVDAAAGFILASIVALRAHCVDPQAPVGVLGLSMGASWALWAAVRQPDSVAAVVAYYGHQELDFDGMSAPALCHLAQHDPLMSEKQALEMLANMRLAGVSVEATTHPETRHFFAESGVPVMSADGAVGERSELEEAAATAAWAESLAFFENHLKGQSAG